MKAALCLVILAVVAVAVGATGSIELEQQRVFVQFMQDHIKVYESPAETFRRFRIFKENLAIIDAHNAQPDVSYLMGVGPFTDLTSAEFMDIMGFAPMEPIHHEPIEMDVPAADIDWRTKGAVTAIKNQKACGSCWAFSAVGALEGAFQIKENNLVSFSEQQLVDCSTSFGNHGCQGGLMDNAFQYYIDTKGACTEHEYPYTEVDTAACQSSCVDVEGSRIKSFVQVADETDLATALAQGPVSVAVAVNTKFQNYKSGVFDDPMCWLTQLNHGVLAVGSKGTAWILKNSWGTTWGEAGYMQIVKGKNMCGVASAASYPVLP
jgi:hypothetical protein